MPESMRLAAISSAYLRSLSVVLMQLAAVNCCIAGMLDGTSVCAIVAVSQPYKSYLTLL